VVSGPCSAEWSNLDPVDTVMGNVMRGISMYREMGPG
jgi:hypothetical protein